jgi:hypothetical protein
MSAAASTSRASVVPILEWLQASAKRNGSTAISLALLDELHSTLASEAEELSRGSKKLAVRLRVSDDSSYGAHARSLPQNTLFGDPFPLISLLLPILSHLPLSQASSTSAKASLLLLATHSSAKEVVLAVGERVDELKMPEDSDEEADWDEEHAADEDGSAPWDPRDAAVQLTTMVQMYSIGASFLPFLFFSPTRHCSLPYLLLVVVLSSSSNHHQATHDLPLSRNRTDPPRRCSSHFRRRFPRSGTGRHSRRRRRRS